MRTHKLSINRIFLTCMLTVGVLSIGILGYLWISSDWARFREETRTLRETYLENRKAVIKREVDRALGFVQYMQAQTEKRLRQNIRERVYEAYAIASNIYGQYRDKHSDTAIKSMIREALRPIRFNKDRGYYFAFNLDGVEILFAVHPEMEGQDMLPVRGGKGERVVPDMLELVQRQGEGFYRYSWSKPEKEGYYPKVAFVKLFEPLNMVIGTGAYLDDVEADIQEECLQWIANLKFGSDGYVFAGQWDGLSLSGPATGSNMYDVEDVNGIKIVQELIRTARRGGGYVAYVQPAFEGRKQGPKISYAVSVPEWQWYIGSGTYVDEIEAEIAAKQGLLHHKIRNNMRHTMIVLLALLVFILLVAKLLSEGVRKNLTRFSHFFNKASSEAITIEQKRIHFSEFSQLAESANRMVAKRRQAEDALQSSHERFLTVLDSIDATIFVADMETYEILFMNKYMIDSYGQDLTGETCWDALRHKEGPCSHCTNPQLVDEDGNLTGVRVWQGLNPVNRKWFINYDRAIEWIDGRIVKIQIATDITDLKRMEEDLRQSHKMEAIGTLAGGVAHEFNNILSIIVGNIELALDSIPAHNEAFQFLEGIKTASFRAKEIVLQLLSFSRRTEEHLHPVRLDNIVRDALRFLRSTIPTSVEFDSDIEPETDAVMADPTQINQVMINLCLNAAQAMEPKGGKLTVAVKQVVVTSSPTDGRSGLSPGTYVEIRVADNGPGIEAHHLERIFDPFFTTKEVGKGSGLGLAVVHGIVQNHRGHIYVESQAGAGTAFTLYFPTVALDATRQTVDTEDIPTGSESVLFVDDEASIVNITRSTLTRIGYQVTTTTQPEKALMLFESDPYAFDLVITDMTMPGLNGIELAAKMMKIRPLLPVIICTGHSDLLDEHKASQLGISAFVLKPISRSKIAATIRRVLDG